MWRITRPRRWDIWASRAKAPTGVLVGVLRRGGGGDDQSYYLRLVLYEAVCLVEI
jgi:hypothetical protein